jgi:O-antigen/teichoic acid export membrane protein
MIPFVVWEHYGSFLLMSADRLVVYNRAQVVGRLVELGLIFSLVVSWGLGVAGALTAALLGQMVVASLGLRLLYRRAGGNLAVSLDLLRSLVRQGLRLHFSTAGSLLVSYVDILVVSHFLGTRDTGLYQFAVQLTSVVLVLPQAVAQVFYSRVAVHGPDGAWPEHRRVLVGLMACMILLSAVAAIVAPVAVQLAVGPAFLPSVPVFRILLLSVIGRTIGFAMAPQWIGRGLFWQASGITFTIGLLDVGLAILLVQSYGLVGAAAASVVAFSIGAVINFALALRIERRRRLASPTSHGLSPAQS